MSFHDSELLMGGETVISFEDLQRGLGSLSLADRETLDKTALSVFEDANSLAIEYGANSPEAARADELVLLYSMLESSSAIYRRRVTIPEPR